MNNICKIIYAMCRFLDNGYFAGKYKSITY